MVDVTSIGSLTVPVLDDPDHYPYALHHVIDTLIHSTMASALKTQKTALRKSMRGVLANLSSEQIQTQCESPR